MSDQRSENKDVRVETLLTGRVGRSRKGAVAIALRTKDGEYAFAVNLEACNTLHRLISSAEQMLRLVQNTTRH